MFAERWYESMIWDLYDGFQNINIFLERVKPYAAYGRTQSEDQARIIDSRIRRLMKDRIDYYVPADDAAETRIMGLLGLDRLKEAA